MDRIRQFRANDGLARWERASDWPMAGLALVFLAGMLLPLVVEQASAWVSAFEFVNIAIWIVFALELAWRAFLAERRWHYIWTHPFDVVIVAVPILRPLRLLRLLVVVGVFTRRAKHGAAGVAMAAVIITTVVLVIVSALVVAEAEEAEPDATIDGVWDGLWWGLSTITTVGYGDEYPTSAVGRVFAVALMVFGVALLGVVTAAVASWFVRADRREEAASAAHDPQFLEAIGQLSDQLADLQRAAATQASSAADSSSTTPSADQ